MKSKNIAVLYPKSQFTDIQLGRLASLGKVTFIESARTQKRKQKKIRNYWYLALIWLVVFLKPEIGYYSY